MTGVTLKQGDEAIRRCAGDPAAGPRGAGRGVLRPRRPVGLRQVDASCAWSPGWRRPSAARPHRRPRRDRQADPSDRGLAMVFQTYALYPHMTVAQNMEFGLRWPACHPKPEVTRWKRRRATPEARAASRRASPAPCPAASASASPSAAPSCASPRLFLFDEPLSNLDAELRVEMRARDSRELHREIGATMIYVTHDQVEAMTLADRIVVLRAGRIEQLGKPVELYNDPDTCSSPASSAARR